MEEARTKIREYRSSVNSSWKRIDRSGSAHRFSLGKQACVEMNEKFSVNTYSYRGTRGACTGDQHSQQFFLLHFPCIQPKGVSYHQLGEVGKIHNLIDYPKSTASFWMYQTSTEVSFALSPADSKSIQCEILFLTDKIESLGWKENSGGTLNAKPPIPGF